MNWQPMSSCPSCHKKTCICESNAKKFAKKLRGSSVLDAAFGEGSLNFHLYSSKKKEYYAQINLRNLSASRMISPNEFAAERRTPLLESLKMREIVSSTYFPDSFLLQLYSPEFEDAIYLEVKEKVKKLTHEQYEKEYKEGVILDF